MADRIVTDYSQQPAQSTSVDSDSGPAKQAVSRGARACQICRAAKMKCVGAEEDGAKPCQRCRRSNNECIFEKHRRGRKPGSKLSEASKMLRKLEKGNGGAAAQKLKSHEPLDIPTQTPFPVSDSRSAPPPESSPYQSRYSPPVYVPSQPHPPPQSVSSSPQSFRSHMEDDDDYDERDEETIYPAKMVEREGRRHSYFGTVLTTPTPVPGHKPTAHHGSDKTSPLHSPGHQLRSRPPTGGPSRLPALPTIDDPLAAGVISEHEVDDLFSIIFKRLNPFVNLLDPALHSPTYVRARCPLLFTVLVMAGSKFFRQDIFRAVQRIAEEMCVVQAFMCMTYWKEPDDTRTWTYIGYAARMAVEIGLNTHCPDPPPGETNLQRLERRNRERTYLVLWVHDRSLSMQTGRQWMLPEDELVRNSEQWYHGSTLLPIDVVVSAQVALRRIAAGVTDVFYLSRAKRMTEDVNYDVLLTGTNQRLQQWNEHWMGTIKNSNGSSFHTSLLTFFKLHVRLFLNSFGLHSSLIGPAPSPSYKAIRYGPSLPALSICYNSAVETLRLVATEFATVDMLRYGQDSITVMTAYSACFLLKVCLIFLILSLHRLIFSAAVS
ncbi:hypothetical protein BU17DRAFT_54837 [Hysterangium stoloniferum]|nr:hypothetical protein BU17DRAFT_54837 [Hysterangium stoloniferum]